MFSLALLLPALLLPSIVATTPLRNTLLSWLVDRDVARVTAQGASLGWFRGPALKNIEAVDPTGQPLFAARAITLDRSPLALVSNQKQLGTITVDGPTFFLAIRPDGSNLEDLLAALARQAGLEEELPVLLDDEPSTTVAVKIAGGTIIARDVASGQVWRVEDVHAEYDSSRAAEGLLQLAASGRVVRDANVAGPQGVPASPGAGSFDFRLEPTSDGRQQAELRVSALPLASLTGWVRRLVDQPQLDGDLTANGSAVWTMAPPAAPLAGAAGSLIPTHLETSGNVTIDRLDFTAPALAGDRFRLARVDMPWRLSGAGEMVSIEQFGVRTEVGELTARGQLETVALEQLWTTASPAALWGQKLEVRGNLSLARLAAMLPRALKVRPGTTITSGDVELSVRNQPVEAGHALTGNVRTVNLAANDGGRSLRWDQPLRCEFDLLRRATGLTINAFECEADFCHLQATGSERDLAVRGDFDLNRLAQQLGQFVDVTAWQLAGTGSGELTWRAEGRNQFATNANFELESFRIAAGDGLVWSEPELGIVARAAGILDDGGARPRRIDAAQLTLKSPTDQLDAQLTSAVEIDRAGALWPLSLSAEGDVGNWLARARPLVSLEGFQAAGQMECSAEGKIGFSQGELSRVKLVLTDLVSSGASYSIDEPRIELAGDVAWNNDDGSLSIREGQLVSSTAAVSLHQLRFLWPEGALPTVTGTVALRADLARVAALRAGADRGWQPRGMLAGNVRFVEGRNVASAELDLRGENLALVEPAAPGARTIWQEPQLQVTGRTTYDPQKDEWLLEALEVQSNMLRLATTGRVQQWSTTRHVHFSGTADYDLAQVTPLLRPYIGPAIEFHGRQQARFEIAGPLGGATPPRGVITNVAQSAAPLHWSQALEGRFEVPWEGASVYGLAVGPGKLVAALGEGGVRFDPLALAVGEGKLNATPAIRLDPPPGQLTLPGEQVLTQVRISPEVSDAMLKYIAPVLAEATRSEGVFSMQLHGARLPLANPRQADVAGRLLVHQVDVLPGPSTQQLVGLIQQIEDLVNQRPERGSQRILKMRDKAIEFRLVDGRVYHEGMEFNVGEVVVRSRGSVGLDETLALSLEVPMREKWIERNRLLAGMRGQSLTIPVAGTLSRPQFDEGAIASLSGQLLQGAAGQALGSELNKALDKLFGR